MCREEKEGQFPTGHKFVNYDPFRGPDDHSEQIQHKKTQVTECSVITNVELKIFTYLLPYMYKNKKKNLEQHMLLSFKDSRLQHSPGKPLAPDAWLWR